MLTNIHITILEIYMFNLVKFCKFEYYVSQYVFLSILLIRQISKISKLNFPENTSAFK